MTLQYTSQFASCYNIIPNRTTKHTMDANVVIKIIELYMNYDIVAVVMYGHNFEHSGLHF